MPTNKREANEGTTLGFMSIEEVAKALGLSKSRIYYLTSNRIIPHYKPNGRKLLFRASELTEWIEQGRVMTTLELETLAEQHKEQRRRKSY